MKLKYRFRVKGDFRLDQSAPLLYQGRVFMFELGSQQEVTHLSVTVQIDMCDLPVISPSSTPGKVTELKLNSPGLEELEPMVRSLEGMLSFYGIHSINMREPELTWIPESPEEKESMTLFSFSMAQQERTLSDQPILPFCYAGQTVASIDCLLKHEIPMYFCRRGTQDLVEGYFIDAFYDFFFILESLFANGKFKKAPTQQAFGANQTLQDAVAAMLASQELKDVVNHRPHTRVAYEEQYKGRTPREVTDHLVELRGFLHHHTADRPNIWHPDEHEKYELDAHVAGLTCFRIIQDAVMPLVFSEVGAQRFQSAVVRPEN